MHIKLADVLPVDPFQRLRAAAKEPDPVSGSDISIFIVFCFVSKRS